MAAADWQALSFPTSIDDAKLVVDVLLRFGEQYPNRLIGVHMVCYLYLQAYAIPGTVFMNLFSGVGAR
jgi:hypothetical protein